MLYAFLAYILPYTIPWMIILNVLYTFNSFGTMPTAQNYLSSVLIVFSLLFSMLSANSTGKFRADASDGPTPRTEIFGGSIMAKGSMGLATIVINNIKVIFTAPFYIIYGLFKGITDFFNKEKNELEDYQKSALVLGLIAIVLSIYPFCAQTYIAQTYDCNDLKIELVSVETNDDASETYFDLEISYPKKELSQINYKTNIYLDEELFTTQRSKLIINTIAIDLSVLDEQGDMDKVFSSSTIMQNGKNKIDFVTLYNERSDRLRITVEIEEIYFHDYKISANNISQRSFIEKIGPITVYSSEEYIENHDMTEENKNIFNSAIELYNQKQYNAALEIFNTIPFYPKSKNYISLCEDAIKKEKYISADDLIAQGKYDEAIKILSALGDYKDSKDKVADCNNKKAEQEANIQNAIKEEKYATAIALLNAEKFDEAKKIFEEIKDYKNSEDKIKECEDLKTDAFYVSAIEKYNNDNLFEALADFTSLNQYKDSANYIKLTKDKIIESAKILACNGELTKAQEMLRKIGYYLGDPLYTAIEYARRGNYNSLMNHVDTKKFVVPDGTTQIYDSAFAGWNTLVEIVLPDSLRKIGAHAFGGCSSLEKINLHDGITVIDSSAFKGCTALKDIPLPNLGN